MKNKTFIKNKTLFAASLALMMALPMQAQRFEDNFEDKTLRLDYIVAGDSVNQAIYFEQAYSMAPTRCSM